MTSRLLPALVVPVVLLTGVVPVDAPAAAGRVLSAAGPAGGLPAVATASTDTTLQVVTALSGAPQPPELSATAAVLMDACSGRVLYAKRATVPRPPASLTKVMTALIALERGRPDEVVTVSAAAAATDGSSVWLEAGETQTLEDLVYGLLLRSGNDCAVAIAEHIAGNTRDFAYLMNLRARELGATGTHFRNPHGLPDSGHVSTALDLALISREALRREDFRRVVSTRRHVIPWPGKPWDRAVYNENRLLWVYPGADGVKTGWTREAGRCLIASATRGGWQLLAVLLDAPDMWADAMELLDWGFTSFRPHLVVKAGAEVARARVAGMAERWVPLVTETDVTVAVLPGEERQVSVRVEPATYLRSPVSPGSRGGSLAVVVGGVPLAPVPLVTAGAVPPGGLVGRFIEDLWVLLVGAVRRLFGLESEVKVQGSLETGGVGRANPVEGCHQLRSGPHTGARLPGDGEQGGEVPLSAPAVQVSYPVPEVVPRLQPGGRA